MATTKVRVALDNPTAMVQFVSVGLRGRGTLFYKTYWLSFLNVTARILELVRDIIGPVRDSCTSLLYILVCRLNRLWLLFICCAHIFLICARHDEACTKMVGDMNKHRVSSSLHTNVLFVLEHGNTNSTSSYC